jgi:hypothetical protein
LGADRRTGAAQAETRAVIASVGRRAIRVRPARLVVGRRVEDARCAVQLGGICLDVGAAGLRGGVASAVEGVAFPPRIERRRAERVSAASSSEKSAEDERGGAEHRPGAMQGSGHCGRQKCRVSGSARRPACAAPGRRCRGRAPTAAAGPGTVAAGPTTARPSSPRRAPCSHGHARVSRASRTAGRPMPSIFLRTRRSTRETMKPPTPTNPVWSNVKRVPPSIGSSW